MKSVKSRIGKPDVSMTLSTDRFVISALVNSLPGTPYESSMRSKSKLTSRVDPLDRVRELGDASVPFTFDVHAMIYSEDAPALEKKLHHHFNHNRVNKINYRKEFFKTQLVSVKKYLEDQGIQAKFTLKAEALQYRESLQIELLPDDEQRKIEDTLEEIEAKKPEYVFEGDGE